MCGRVVQVKELQTYARELAVPPSASLPNAPPRYNGAPSQDLLVLRRHPQTGEDQLSLLRWGLIPHWAKDKTIAWKMVNARAETLGTAPAFRDAYRARRCLVPVDGFYEWKRIGKVKQPFLIAMKSSEPFTLAALWENWRDRDSNEWVRTFTIVTTKANALVSALHDRMPVIIDGADRECWLDRAQDVAPLLRPYPAELMTMWPVSTQVNSPKNEGRELIEPITLEPEWLALPEAKMRRANDAGLAPSDSE